MKKIIIIQLLICAFSICLLSQVQKQTYLDLVFENRTDFLTIKSEASVHDFFSKKREYLNFEIETFPGSAENIRKNRSQNVSELLVEFGFKAEKIVHFQKRVHLYFDGDKSDISNLVRLKIEYKKSQLIKINAISKDERFSHKITINSRTATTLNLKKGSIIKIPANAFSLSDGTPYHGEVVFKSREILTKADAILANVTTNLAGGGVLESNGMIDLAAETISGETLEISDGKQLEINITSSNSTSSEDWKIYKGSGEDGDLDWLLETSKLLTKEYQFFEWKRLKKDERDSIRLIRTEYINQWSKKQKKKVIKRRLKYCHSYVKRRSKKNRNGRKFKKTRSDRDYSKLSKAMILGKTRYSWKKVTPTFYERPSSSNRFFISQLGMYNIDKLFQPKARRQNVIVKNTEGKNLKLIYKKWFIVIRGEKIGSETIFRNVIQNEDIVIVSTEEQPNGEMNFGFIETTPVEKALEIEDYYIVSKKELATKVISILGDSGRG